ncbi:MAG: hypothetical protein J1F38_06245 [Muribaculaceae bacterium]|nr:hypothetical protein [Muribaculaceae bacterium]
MHFCKIRFQAYENRAQRNSEHPQGLHNCEIECRHLEKRQTAFAERSNVKSQTGARCRRQLTIECRNLAYVGHLLLCEKIARVAVRRKVIDLKMTDLQMLIKEDVFLQL